MLELNSKNYNCFFCAHSNGIITIRDQRTFNIERTIQSHTGGITDMDIKDNLLVTCGWSKRYKLFIY